MNLKIFATNSTILDYLVTWGKFSQIIAFQKLFANKFFRRRLPFLIDLFIAFFSNFWQGQVFGKIGQHHWIERPKISKTA